MDIDNKEELGRSKKQWKTEIWEKLGTAGHEVSNQKRRMNKYQEEIKANDLCNNRGRKEKSSD